MSYEDDPDVRLMLAFQRGDETAFEQLFVKHVDRVVSFAAQFVRDRARAEELAQDVFLRIYRNRQRYLPKARFSTWLFRMVTNACVSEKRRPSFGLRLRSVHPIEEGERPEVEIPTASVEQGVASSEELQKARRLIAGLPEQQRAALLLARAEGLAYDEVAQALGCSVSAVKSLVHRATVALRDGMREEV